MHRGTNLRAPSEEVQAAQDASSHGADRRANQGPLQSGIVTVASVSFDPRPHVSSSEEATRRAHGRPEYPSRGGPRPRPGRRLRQGWAVRRQPRRIDPESRPHLQTCMQGRSARRSSSMAGARGPWPRNRGGNVALKRASMFRARSLTVRTILRPPLGDRRARREDAHHHHGDRSGHAHELTSSTPLPGGITHWSITARVETTHAASSRRHPPR